MRSELPDLEMGTWPSESGKRAAGGVTAGLVFFEAVLRQAWQVAGRPQRCAGAPRSFHRKSTDALTSDTVSTEADQASTWRRRGVDLAGRRGVVFSRKMVNGLLAAVAGRSSTRLARS